MKLSALALAFFGLLGVCGLRFANSTITLDEAVLNAPSVRDYSARIQKSPAVLVESIEDDAATVAVGESLDTHFTRGLTLLVYVDGRVLIRSENQDGDEQWQLDYSTGSSVILR